jgi:phage host-nuclease inhibitor protein Gam
LLQRPPALCVNGAKDRTALEEREALERMLRTKVENAAVLASAHEDAKGLIWKITLLEGELVAGHQAWELSEREHREQFKELTLL